MLSLKQIEVETKKHKLDITMDGWYYFLRGLPIFNQKDYEEWKKKTLKQWQLYDQRQIDYYTKYGYTQSLHSYQPISKGPRVEEKNLRREYKKSIMLSDFGGLCLQEDQSRFSCAINEFGGFPERSNKLDKYWDLLLSYYVNKSKYHYFKCATPVKPAYAGVRAGLKKVGFEMRASERSNHGRYFVEVWEYIKPKKKETKKKGKK